MTEEIFQDEKRAYEVTMLSMEEDLSRVKNTIAKFGGEILDEKPQGKIRLAYLLQKQSYAFLDFLKIKLSRTGVSLLLNELKLDGGVLRFFINTQRAEENRISMAPRTSRPMFRRSGASIRPKPNVAQSLTNEALEKKIEEISQ
jgi:ribosomal protein S6